MTDTQRKIDPLDVEALEKSLNDSATRVSAIWISYLAFGLYLLAATINVSHRQLFLADAMKLPVLGIDLPLFGFFLFAPLLFVIFHVYVLVQLLLLSRTALAYNDAVDSALTSAEDRTRIRQRLANTLFAQLLAGSPREREGLLGVILKVMALATLAVAPLLILLAFQIQFLPYHSTTITWAHRLFIIADWAAVLMFWPAIMNPQREIETRLLKRPASAAPTIILVLFVVLVPSFPGEPQAPLTRAGRYFIPPSESKSPHCNGRSWFEWLMPNNFDRISLPGEDLIEDDKIARAAKVRRLGRRFASQAELSRSFQNRDFSCGWFVGSGLRYADFSGAVMHGASLGSADLEGATFISTQLQGANLFEAKMPRARFIGANLEGATLYLAQLQSASFGNSALSGANLSYGRLLGANLSNLRGYGVNFEYAEMTGADLRWSDLKGAKMNGARLRGADLSYARLEGADLKQARLDAANLSHAQLQGAQLGNTTAKLADLSDASLWRAQGMSCSEAYGTAQMQARIMMGTASSDRTETDATPQTISALINRTVQNVPDWLRKDLQDVLTGRLNAAPSAPPACMTAEVPLPEYAGKLEAAMTDLTCTLGADRAYILERLQTNLDLGLFSVHERALAAGLLGADERSCAGGKMLDDAGRAALQSAMKAWP